MTLQPSTDPADEDEKVLPAANNIIYLQHPTNPDMRFKLWRSSLSNTLLKHGYVEITEAQYEAEEDR